MPRVDPLDLIGELRRDECFVIGQCARERDEMRADSWDRRFESGEELEPHDVAEVTEVAIRAVFAPRSRLGFEPASDLFSGPGEQWTNDSRVGFGPDSGQRARSSAAQKLHENTFADVVAVMRSCDRIDRKPCCEPMQRAVALDPPGTFSALMFGFSFFELEDVALDVKISAQVGTELCVSIRFGPSHAVMDVCRDELQSKVLIAKKM
jgi:hypothetical protein